MLKKSLSTVLSSLLLVSLVSACSDNVVQPALDVPTNVQAQASASKSITIDVSSLEDSKTKIKSTTKENQSGKAKNKASKNLFKFNVPLKNSGLDNVSAICFKAVTSMTGQRSSEAAYKTGREYLEQLSVQNIYKARLATAAINNCFRSDSANWYDGVKLLLVTFTHMLAEKENTPESVGQLLKDLSYAPDTIGPAYFAIYAALEEVSKTDNNEVRSFVQYNLESSKNLYNANNTAGAHRLLQDAAEKVGRQDYRI